MEYAWPRRRDFLGGGGLRHLGILAGALTLLTACGGASTSSTSAASAKSAADMGGMDALVAAAKREGTLNVIALPPDWANYGVTITAFQKKYGIHVNSAAPNDSSQQEARSRRGRRWYGGRAQERRPLCAVPGDNVERHRREFEGAHRPVGPGLQRRHGGRLRLQQGTGHHIDSGSARSGLQEQGRPSWQRAGLEPGGELDHGGQPQQRWLAR